MVDVTRSFPVQRPIEEVVAYLRDFANAVEWDPGTQSCEPISTGAIGVGSRWHNETKLYGISTTLTYELTRDDPDHLVFTGTNKTATSTEDLSFVSLDSGHTEVTYHAHVDFNGAARLADPLAQLGFKRLAPEVAEQMKRAIENAPAAGSVG
ncbi:Polyketide cyclase/dehydrase [Gordonia bronchialis DSM 43247]|uniref:Polyketide cyclase/dehydrase n=1 Tax=Gordonia bronchialis (strain ATCC 25592 / DSM 43247 / BCRC 13721 / JCM 3198 / KCTC 3076 / NBRC 16047 / NCTC 10667) TaxID=526226 RepID=D0LB41_GORB4|nr:SRPBCC family protein [Gordonia bronchialis]ACY19472.1 Polyketide cyclase/dehydrase [Gordonia bronchialis DSM 43247]MCC3322252.1 SRPBCC family protein [Gordonia bronchialis]QGS26596.1 polyketide cyclase [Gordonia bronchialis]